MHNDSFRTENPHSASPIIVLCDHASRHIPGDISENDLGLNLGDLERHIAYDVGALGLVKLLRDYFQATLIHTQFSRLLIDANRSEDDPTLVMRLYDGTIVPGNRHLRPGDMEHRLARFHRPYQNEIGRQIDAKISRGLQPVLLSIHSFTPQLRQRGQRPWHLGVLWAGDNRLAQNLIAAFATLPGVCVGDNQPYAGLLPGCTLDRHGAARGLPHVLIEFRNDLIEDASGQAEWAGKVLPLLEDVVMQPHHREMKFG